MAQSSIVRRRDRSGAADGGNSPNVSAAPHSQQLLEQPTPSLLVSPDLPSPTADQSPCSPSPHSNGEAKAAAAAQAVSSPAPYVNATSNRIADHHRRPTSPHYAPVPAFGGAASDAQLLHVVGIPLLILASVAIVFLLAYGKDILQPLFIAVFFSYLLKPMINLLTTPFSQCLDLCCRRKSSSGPEARSLLSTRDRERERSVKGSLGAVSEDRALSIPSSDAHEDNVDTDDTGLMPAMDDEATGLLGGVPANHPSRDDQAICGMKQLPRPVAVIISLVVVLTMIAVGVLMIADAIQTFESESLEVYEVQAIKLRDEVLSWTKEHFNVDGTYLMGQLSTNVSLSDVFKSLFVFLFDMISGMFLVLLFIMYLLFEKDDQRTLRSNSIRAKIDQQITHYIVLKTLISLLAGVLVYVILGPVLTVHMANLFAVLTFLLNFIPNVGPVIATLLPLPVVLFDPRLSGMQMLLAVMLPGSVHFLVGNFVEPAVFGHSMEMHPVFLLLSLAFWYAVWGVPGAILSVPMTAVVKIVMSYSRHPFSVMIVHVMEGNISAMFGEDEDYDDEDGASEEPKRR